MSTKLMTTAVLPPRAAGRKLEAVSGAADAVPPVPDSTTIVDRLADFHINQDVLLKKDGKYYCGTVVAVDVIREQCYVKFGDNTDSWACFKELVKLSTPKDPMCVVCRKSAPNHRNEIKECDKCKRSYHRRCHQPHIDGGKEELFWMCKRCTDAETVTAAAVRNTRRSSVATSSIPKPLPYDPEALNWDTYHRENIEHTYCYCGQKGMWDTQMLQCTRCRQWFHEKCLACLRFPVYCGDRFYAFVCANCNEGREFVRRLEINWVELVHLMLFNLTIYKAKKYFDLDGVIMPYVQDNWHALQLPPKILHVGAATRREYILNVLTSNRNRFKCGREVKKRTTIWGLRVRLPPPAPTIQLATKGIIGEHELKVANRQLQFLPYHDHVHMRISSDVMMGASYQDDQVQSETESLCGSPKSDEEEEEDDEEDFIGVVKKNALKQQKKQRLLTLSSRKRDKIMRRQKRKGVKEAPSRRLTRLSLDSNLSTLSGKSGKKMHSPLTPPTSVSAPPTPPNSGSGSNGHSELSMDYNDSNAFVLSLKNLKKDDPHTPCDTSGDETSSKSTLDLIIPPPKDFEGKNNPFRTDEARKRRSKNTMVLPLPRTSVNAGKSVPVHRKPLSVKRQLSEKDILVGPNGEVKRRRLRRTRSLTYASGGTASKTAAIVPVRADLNWSNPGIESQPASGGLVTDCVDYALNGRRLRQRQNEKEQQKEASKPPTPMPSPAKTEPDISMDDLKSSVHSYFGAATRIQDGERFTVKAKRYGPTGRLEYLMEWEGVNNTMKQ